MAKEIKIITESGASISIDPDNITKLTRENFSGLVKITTTNSPAIFTNEDLDDIVDRIDNA